LGLLCPEPTAEADTAWATTLFPRGAFVYPDHGALWVTARELESRGAFTVPDDCRTLVEAVYGEEAAETMPDALKQVHDHEYGRERAEGSLGSQNALKIEEGYLYGTQSWEDDIRTPTRLGEESTTVRLVRRTAEGYEPWHTEASETSHWELSQIQVPTRLVAAEDPAQAKLHETLRATMRDQGRYCVLVVMEKRDRLALGEAIDDKSRKVSLAYGELGLRVLMQ
jgi:CRISPR-associated endonuclease/helicase Cas3